MTTGGLAITSGGATITTTDATADFALAVQQGATISNTRANNTVLKVSAGLDAHNGTVLLVETNAQKTANEWGYQDLIKTVINADADNSAPGQVIFRVHSEPRTEVMLGGFRVHAGGATVKAGGLVVQAGGMTIGAGGLALTGDVTFSSGVYMTGTADMQGESVRGAKRRVEGTHALKIDVRNVAAANFSFFDSNVMKNPCFASRFARRRYHC